MKAIQINRLAITIIFTGQEALKVPEMYQKAKQLNPHLTQKEIFMAGLEKILKNHSK